MLSDIIVLMTIVIFLDIIRKSIADKKKIEEAKMRRMKNPKARPITIETNSFPNEVRRENPITEYEDKTTEISSLAQEKINLDNNVKDKEIVKQNKDVNTIKNKSILNKRLKNEIIKGIIYSEILSEPKSVKNIRKGI